MDRKAMAAAGNPLKYSNFMPIKYQGCPPPNSSNDVGEHCKRWVGLAAGCSDKKGG